MEELNKCFITTTGSTSPIFFKNFIYKKHHPAKLWVCGLGFCITYINGILLDDSVLDPVTSDYHKRDIKGLLYPISDTFSYSTYYREYDISSFLIEGENEIKFWLGNGWYHQNERNVEGYMDYGFPKLAAIIDTGDEIIKTDLTWNYIDSPILKNNLFFGEVYDANFKDTLHKTPIWAPQHDTVMRLQKCPPNKVIRKIIPKKISGNLYDVGENTTGWVKICTSAPKGEMIELYFAENINENELDFASCGGNEQKQGDKYISDGTKNQIYAPRFTYHGFRYFTIIGDAVPIACEVVHCAVTELPVEFHSSSDTLNWLVDTFKATLLSGLQSGVPLDCPHRERLGYTGDGQLTCRAAMELFDMNAFYRKWIRDIKDSQCKISGHVQHTAPFYGGGGGPGWGSAIIYVPYYHYKKYGEIDILQDNYNNMRRWIEYLYNRTENGVVVREEEGGWCLGEWCTPKDRMQLTPEFVNTYHLAKCVQIMIDISDILNLSDEKNEYILKWEQLIQVIKLRFYNHDTNTYDCGCEGSCAFAYDLGIASEQDVKTCIEQYKKTKHFDTGIFGTPLLFNMLCETGNKRLALEMIENPTPPSFEYMRSMGATTLWETWDGSASHNHAMFGAVVYYILKYFK